MVSDGPLHTNDNDDNKRFIVQVSTKTQDFFPEEGDSDETRAFSVKRNISNVI